MDCRSCNKPMYVGLTTAVCDTPGCPEYVAPAGADTEPAPAPPAKPRGYVDYQTKVWAGYWGIEIAPEDTTETVREKIFKRAGVRYPHLRALQARCMPRPDLLALYGGAAGGGKMQALAQDGPPAPGETYSNTLDIVVDETSHMSSSAYRTLRKSAERAIDEAILGKVSVDAPLERWRDPPSTLTACRLCGFEHRSCSETKTWGAYPSTIEVCKDARGCQDRLARARLAAEHGL